MKARYVVMSDGPLNRPKLPGIVGLESFEGHCFHISRWDYGYTGGDAEGNQYGGGPEAFFQLIKEWREEGSLEGLNFS